MGAKVPNFKIGEFVVISPAYWENTLQGHSKFWEIAWTTKTSWVTAYGRIGAIGSSKERRFSSTWEAEREFNKILGEKSAKGYKKRTRPVTRAAISIQGFKGGMGLVIEVGTYSSKVLDQEGAPVQLPNDFLVPIGE